MAAAPQAGAKTPLPNIAIEEVRIEKASFTQRDGQTGKTMQVAIDHLILRAKSLTTPLSLDLAGLLDGNAFALSGTTGPVADILAAKPWPFDLSAKAGFALAAQIKAAGTFVMTDKLYSLDNLKLELGKSALSGSAKVALGTKPKATVRLASDVLDLSELAPTSEEGAAAREKKTSGGRVFPADPLPLDGLKSIDADAEISIGKLILPNKMALNDMTAKAILKNGLLEVKPLALKLGGGAVTSDIVVDAGTQSLILTVS